MAYFPFFVDLSGQKGLIVGGGTVALRKAEKLLPYGPELTVVAPEPIPALTALPVTLERRRFRETDLEGAGFVIAATDDREENHRISALCRGQNVPVNAVDDREACSFLFPALVRRGDLSVGISTGGSSPAAAAWVRRTLEDQLPPSLEPILVWLEEQRAIWRDSLPQPGRGDWFTQLFSAALEAGRPLTGEETASLLHQFSQEVSP